MICQKIRDVTGQFNSTKKSVLYPLKMKNKWALPDKYNCLSTVKKWKESCPRTRAKEVVIVPAWVQSRRRTWPTLRGRSLSVTRSWHGSTVHTVSTRCSTCPVWPQCTRPTYHRAKVSAHRFWKFLLGPYRKWIFFISQAKYFITILWFSLLLLLYL